MIDSVQIERSGPRVITFDPRKIKYDEDGIPVLTVRQIEAVAKELLGIYCQDVMEGPKMTRVVEIIQKLGERTKLSFEMQDLGWNGTAKVLGKVSFHKRTLCLDFSLQGERAAAFRFTAAHEIGHWVLHRHNYKKWNFDSSSPTKDWVEDDEHTLCCLSQRRQRGWLEFQANVFAAELVTPRDMFVTALVEIQLAMDIKKNIGLIYLSNNNSSQRDFEIIVARLSEIFGVSKQCVRVRIKTLQLLEYEGNSRLKYEATAGRLPI